jgi:ABC-2 type transport system permease protein
MNPMTVFASRNSKEIIRDRLNVMFGVGFPVVLLLLLTAIQSNVPVSLFEISNLTPGIAVFGLSFISLFSGMLIAKDKTSSLLLRLFSSPMRSSDYILGYAVPLIPMAIAQITLCFIVAFFLGLTFNLHVLLAILVLIPAAILFIGIGLLCGSLFNDKQVSGICGALLTNLSAWLSGTWFDLNLVGGWFERIASILPFAPAVDAARAALNGDYIAILSNLWIVLAYAVVILVIAVVVFRKKMHGENV